MATDEARQYVADLASVVMVVHEDYSPDPEATAEIREWLLRLASAE